MVSVIRSNLVDLPTNVSLSYFWCGGFMLSVFLVLQVVSGIGLSFVYTANASLAFFLTAGFCGEDIYLWLLRYAHIWGATFIFLILFVHMGRSLYYSSYTKVGVWNVGFVLYLLMMVEAFLGYILPWHQMSYWAATVLTSILKSVPLLGGKLYEFVLGGFGVTDVALIRVFPAHVSLAFIIVGLSVLHMFYLHSKGSNNPLFISGGYSDTVAFHSYYTLKDGYVCVCLLFLFCWFIFVSPDLVLDPESFIEADPMVTPVTIKPEWYFLAYYAMLRSIQSKIGGLILVLVFLFVLWVPTRNEACVYYVDRQFLFWSVCSSFVGLSYLGACHPVYPYFELSKAFSFILVLFLFMFKGLWEVPYSNWLIRGHLASNC